MNFRTLLESGDIERAPAFYNVLENVDVFIDNHKQFQDYLNSEGISNVPKLYKLQLRPRNRIYPKVRRGDTPLHCLSDYVTSSALGLP